MATAPIPWDADGNSTYSSIGYDQYSETSKGYMDREGNVWDSTPYITEEGGWSSPKLLLSSEVTKDPYISTAGIVQQDMDAAQALYDLKKSNPTEFYNQIVPMLSDKIYADWRMNNTNSSTQVARDLIAGVKDINPQAYYTAQLTDLGRNVGWQIGQNRNDRNAPTIERIKALVPDAMKAGLSASQIDSIVGNNVNAANAFNQQRIANEAASGGNFWTENLIGALKVGGLALGAYGLDTALGAGAAAAEAGSAAGGVAGGTSTGTGLTGGAGGSTGLLGGGTVGTISAPTSAGALGLNAAAESAIAAGAGAGLSTGASSFAPAGVGGLNAALPAAGSVGGAGAMSAALPAGTIIGDGTLGTILGASYAASAPGQFATDILGNAIPASSIGIGSTGAAGGYELLSNLGNALKGAQVAKGLLGAGKNPAVNQPMGVQPMQQQQKQYAGVDYSPILNLLAVKSPERTRTSLLG